MSPNSAAITFVSPTNPALLAAYLCHFAGGPDIVERNVQTTEAIHRRLHQTRREQHVARVAGDGERPATVRFDLGHQRIELGPTTSANDEAGAFHCEQLCRCIANA
ncbi:hypothetical protein GGD41_002185 [Paraburkholderia bryophila]|uniref:Uncharacterized protein n=1 Tax=Paraburkholderia bryophila TaxID=420952 RepID=A0A7Y9W6P3_9BURK|nr:hypothetical protein [Paraburkholderia bryophila]